MKNILATENTESTEKASARNTAAEFSVISVFSVAKGL